VQLNFIPIATYQYNGIGQKISSLTSPPRYYYYSDRWQILEERDVDTGAVLQNYAWGTQYIDDLAVVNLLSPAPVAFEANFNVVTRFDTGGPVSSRIVYDGYGKPKQVSANWSTWASITEDLHLFTGRLYVKQHEQYDFRHRTQDPQLGRFVQRDPIGIWADVYNRGNGYAYVAADPLNKTDPMGTGECACSDSEQNDCNVDCQIKGAKSGQCTREGFFCWFKMCVCYDGTYPHSGGMNSTSWGDILIGVGGSILAGVVIGEAAGALLEGECFPAGTLIATPYGDRRIEDLKVGDLVWTRDTDLDLDLICPVEQTFLHATSDIVIIDFGDDSVETTSNHLFWVTDLGWVQAQYLRSGECLGSQFSEGMQIVQTYSVPKSCEVYNIQVGCGHTYFVTDLRLLVHNKPVDVGDGGFEKMPQGDNTKKNKWVHWLVKKLIKEIDPSADVNDILEEVHEAITQQDFTNEEIEEIVRGILGG
jgi:RHS repeat-associated protein